MRVMFPAQRIIVISLASVRGPRDRCSCPPCYDHGYHLQPRHNSEKFITPLSEEQIVDFKRTYC